MDMERAKQMVKDLRQVEEDFKGTRYGTFETRIDDMARAAADMIVSLAEDIERQRLRFLEERQKYEALEEKVKKIALDDLQKINYINYQLSECSKKLQEQALFITALEKAVEFERERGLKNEPIGV